MTSSIEVSENRRNCLICYSAISSTSTEAGRLERHAFQSKSSLELQLEAIFLLRKVLQLPVSHLEQFLRSHGHPSEWGLGVCSKCSENIDRIWGIFTELQRIQKKFEKATWEMREVIRRSSKAVKQRDDRKVDVHIVDKCRRSVSKKVEVEPNTFSAQNALSGSGDFLATQLSLKMEVDELEMVSTTDSHHSTNDDRHGSFEEHQDYCPMDFLILGGPSDPGSAAFSEPAVEVEEKNDTPKVKVSKRSRSKRLREPSRRAMKKSQEASSNSGDPNIELDGKKDGLSSKEEKADSLRETSLESSSYPCYQYPVQCTVCSSESKNYHAFLAHVRSYHVGHYKCLQCTSTFSYAQNCHKSHWEKHHKNLLKKFPEARDRCEKIPSVQLPVFPWWCPKCPQKFEEEALRNAHLQEHEPEHVPEVNLKCKKCNKSFFTQDEVSLHTIQSHPKLAPVECVQCLHSFYTEATFEAHRSSVHQGEPLECPEEAGFQHTTVCTVCKKTVARRALSRHIRLVHQRSLTATCEVCGFLASHKSFLPEHMAAQHGIGEFHCDVEGCVKVFHKERLLKEHKLYKHEGQKRPGRGSHLCRFCGKHIVGKRELRDHEKVVHGEVRLTKPHVCSICSKRFADRRYLGIHLRGVHQVGLRGHLTKAPEDSSPTIPDIKSDLLPAKPSHKYRYKSKSELTAICGICGAVLHKYSLANHIKAVHEKSLAVTCELCGVSVACKKLLPQHMAGVHGIGDFHCDVEGCAKVFHTEVRLKEHKAYTHEGQTRPLLYTCRFCTKQFAHSKNRKVHEDAQHGMADKSHICDICQKGFQIRHYLLIHKRRVHKRKDVPVERTKNLQ